MPQARNKRGKNKRVVEILLAALLLPVVPALAQQALAGAQPNLAATATMQLASGGFAENSPMPNRFSAYAEGKSPPLQWTAVAGAKSYLLIVEDPDAKPVTVVHWVICNIPGNVTSLPGGVPQDATLGDPQGALQGQNSHKSTGYAGPHPPAGDPDHHYHFQIFALDQVLKVQPGASRDAVLAAAAGHVVAKGELIGLFAKNHDSQS